MKFQGPGEGGRRQMQKFRETESPEKFLEGKWESFFSGTFIILSVQSSPFLCHQHPPFFEVLSHYCSNAWAKRSCQFCVSLPVNGPGRDP